MAKSNNTEVEIEVVLINGRVRCAYINNLRVFGDKPYVSEPQKVERFKTTLENFTEALRIKQR